MVDVVALVVLLVMYAAVMAVGIVAARLYKAKDGTTQTEMALVAGRQLSGIVGIFTMTATTVGGGFINGTAESVATWGLAWTLAPFGIFIGLVLAGVVFAKKMRNQNYLTMLDPFQDRYGDFTVGLLYLAAVCGDLFWSASILAALGSTLSVIINLDVIPSVLISAAVAVGYTLFGHMISVAYTDIIQLVLIVVGLVLCVPFAMTHPQVTPLSRSASVWIGSIDARMTAQWIDLFIAMTLGTIPWQTYFQRVLSVKTAHQAQLFSICAAGGALVLSVPPVLIGAVGASANWTGVGAVSPVTLNQSAIILPQVLNHFTPRPVAIIGLGAVAAAVMSSTDSAILSSASMFTHNVYAKLIHKEGSDKELRIVQSIAVLGVGVIATVMAIYVSSIYGMFIMAADIVFVIMFPQLTAVLFINFTNSYGAIAGYITGLILRLGAGEQIINLSPFIYYPFYDKEQLFPFRTFAMVCSFVTILAISLLTRLLFTKNILPSKLDVLHCYSSSQPSRRKQRENTSHDTVIGNNVGQSDTEECLVNHVNRTNVESTKCDGVGFDNTIL